MLKKLFVALVVSAFALGAHAQADKSGTTKAEPKGQTGVATEKAEPGKATAKSTKATKKTKRTKSKDDAKDSRKDATKENKK